MNPRLRSLLPFAFAGLFALPFAAVDLAQGSGASVLPPDHPVPRAPLAAVEEARCEVPSAGTVKTSAGDPRLRETAQQGLDFIASSAVTWQGQHNCYGCHVQAVSTQALAVGMDNQYRVDTTAFSTLIKGVTTLPGGSRSAGGLQYDGGSLRVASKGLGAPAFAAVDARVDDRLRDDLLQVAGELLEAQQPNGQVVDPERWVNEPVGSASLFQLNYEAMVAWRQAYERSADDRWLTALARSEDWVRGAVPSVGADSEIQEINYAILAMAAAGSTPSEGATARLVDLLRARQTRDGGWGSRPGAPADAFSTGQALTALRTVGFGDEDGAVHRGTAWLVEHQGADGSWSNDGSQKAEAMWAVMGLVSVDVLSISVEGLVDGTHVEGRIPLEVTARDNEGRGVTRVELWVDDLRVASGCGAELKTSLDSASLASGAHVVEARAVNAEGKESRRRFEVYSGDHSLVRAGSEWGEGATTLSVRNLLDAGTVKLSVLDREGEVVHEDSAPAREGAMSFRFEGVEGARYTARFQYLDAAGRPAQTLELAFVHDDPAAQAATYAQLGGRVALPEGTASTNTMVELLDAAGNVISTTLTTREGAYNFKNVEEGEYQVRVKKDGYDAPAAAPVKAEKGKSQDADVQL